VIKLLIGVMVWVSFLMMGEMMNFDESDRFQIDNDNLVLTIGLLMIVHYREVV
jgi:hypothetical protein